MNIELKNNMPTLVVLIAVVFAIALLPKYKHNLQQLNHNVAGLIVGFICVIMFFLIDPKVAVLLLFVIVVFYYTSVKEETTNNLNNLSNNQKQDTFISGVDDLLAIEKQDINNIITRTSNKLNEELKNTSVKNNETKIEGYEDEFRSVEGFQSTSERMNEGFVRDKVPEVHRHELTLTDPKKLITNKKEGFKNHLENNNINELLSQNRMYSVNVKDVTGCRYDGKKMLNGEYEEYYGKPLADCSNYTKQGVENTGTAFYPLNR